ncbi:MAG: DUF3054 domain-containing protein [Microthrixaceae bacterium]
MSLTSARETSRAIDNGAVRWSRGLAWVALADVAVVLVFVSTGRSSHDEGLAIGSILATAAPFLLALAGGWGVLTGLRVKSALGSSWAGSWTRMRAPWPEGVALWLVTAALGLTLRNLVFGKGTAASFVVVAFVVLGVGLVGWRAALGAARRRAQG